VSIITIHELVYGIERLQTGSQRQKKLQGVIDEFLNTFAESILPATESIARTAGTMRAKAHKEGPLRLLRQSRRIDRRACGLLFGGEGGLARHLH
jgi:predicted nucleic acid-binding protein